MVDSFDFSKHQNLFLMTIIALSESQMCLKYSVAHSRVAAQHLWDEELPTLENKQAVEKKCCIMAWELTSATRLKGSITDRKAPFCAAFPALGWGALVFHSTLFMGIRIKTWTKKLADFIWGSMYAHKGGLAMVPDIVWSFIHKHEGLSIYQRQVNFDMFCSFFSFSPFSLDTFESSLHGISRLSRIDR